MNEKPYEPPTITKRPVIVMIHEHKLMVEWIQETRELLQAFRDAYDVDKNAVVTAADIADIDEQLAVPMPWIPTRPSEKKT